MASGYDAIRLVENTDRRTEIAPATIVTIADKISGIRSTHKQDSHTALADEIHALLDGNVFIPTQQSQELLSSALRQGSSPVTRALLELPALEISPQNLSKIVDHYAAHELRNHTAYDRTDMLWALKGREGTRISNTLLHPLINEAIQERRIHVCNSLLNDYDGDKRPFLLKLARTLQSEKKPSLQEAFNCEHYNNVVLAIIDRHAPLTYRFESVKEHIEKNLSGEARLMSRLAHVKKIRPGFVEPEESVVALSAAADPFRASMK